MRLQTAANTYLDSVAAELADVGEELSKRKSAARQVTQTFKARRNAAKKDKGAKAREDEAAGDGGTDGD